MRDTIDSNDILDSHLSRVQLESPQERPVSPPRFSKRVRHPATVQSSRYPVNDPFVVTSSTGVVASKQMMTSAQLQMLPIRSKPVAGDNQGREVQMGVVPEITNNSVPDVSTPVSFLITKMLKLKSRSCFSIRYSFLINLSSLKKFSWKLVLMLFKLFDTYVYKFFVLSNADDFLNFRLFLSTKREWYQLGFKRRNKKGELQFSFLLHIYYT